MDMNTKTRIRAQIKLALDEHNLSCTDDVTSDITKVLTENISDLSKLVGIETDVVKRLSLDYRPDPVDLRDHRFSSSLPYRTSEEFAAVVQAVDHTIAMSPVKNQGYLGSCVGFAVTALKEWQEQKEHAEEVAAGKKNHRDDKYYDLSESWTYWMAKKIDPWPGIEGTSIRYAMKVLNKIGCPTEKAWPYDDIVYGEPKKWASLVARWSLIGSYWRIETLEDLKAALVTSPIPIGIGCFEEIFYVGSDGIVSYPKEPEYCLGGHAVCAVGFDDTTGLIKFKNSWSSRWGALGYGYISYDYIQDYLWDAWTCQDLSVTKEMLKESRALLSNLSFMKRDIRR